MSLVPTDIMVLAVNICAIVRDTAVVTQSLANAPVLLDL